MHRSLRGGGCRWRHHRGYYALATSGSITFTDLDLTDLPTATEVTQSVNTTKVGGLTGAQQTAIENAFSISPDALNTNNGTINWTYTITEGELDFLAAGETVTDDFHHHRQRR